MYIICSMYTLLTTESLPVLASSYALFVNNCIVTKVLIVEFVFLTEIAINVAISWDIAPWSPYVNRRFVGTYYFHLQGKK
jgi:hypothetical protein